MDFMHHDSAPNRPATTSTQPRRRRAPRLALGLTAVVALALALAACGGASAKPASTTTTAPSSAAGTGRPNAAALQAFRDCMQKAGVTIPTAPPRPAGQTPTTDANGSFRGGGGGGGGRGLGGGLGGVFNSTDPNTQAALKGCESKLPAGFLQQQQQRQNALAAFNSCMKDHGVTIAPATPGAPSPSTTIDRTSDAYKTCSLLLPARPNGGPGGAGSSSTSTTAPAQ